MNTYYKWNLLLNITYYFIIYSEEDAGIEMQILGSSEMPSRLSVENQSDEISYANSAVSYDCIEPTPSTIGN